MAARFEHIFPAIRGVQARREYYVAMCPLGLLRKLFLFEDEEVPPELRAQRRLNRGRAPAIARYLVQQRDSYVFSALTASIDAEVRFEVLRDEGAAGYALGQLRVPMKARFIINDGQHRTAAIEQALRECPDLEDETIPIVLFMDRGLKRAQQMFADLNQYTIRPTRSLSVLYDSRDEDAEIARRVAQQVEVFRGLTEFERSTLSPRSSKLFTLSALYSATESLLQDQTKDDLDTRVALATRFWATVAEHMPEWQLVKKRKVTAGDVRQDYISGHGLVLAALGDAGRMLLQARPDDWPKALAALDGLDWSRANATVWEGRATVGGRVAKSRTNVVLTAGVVKKQLGLKLSAEDLRLEVPLKRSRNGDRQQRRTSVRP
jgi:DNA sulfur modification protein DndB